VIFSLPIDFFYSIFPAENRMRTTVASFLLVAFFATGCSTTIEVMMSGQSDMNGGGNAAVVQVYELSGEGNFQDISFRAFWQQEGALSKLVGSPHRKTVYPDETTTFELEVAEDTKLVGVAANLRNPDSEQWRALFPVEEVGDRLSVTVRDTRISVDVEGEGALDKVGL
jgi:type VI secretion system VasD/TssJ family lipoprotein